MLPLVLILLTATMLARFLARGKRWGMPLTAALAVATTVAAVWSVLSPTKFTAGTQARLMGGVAHRMAQELKRDFPDGGTLVLAAWNDFNETFDGFNKGFLEVFLKHPDMKRFTVVTVSPPPADDEANYRRILHGFPLGLFRQWAGATPDAVAMVSLVGLPSGFHANQASGLPPLYVANAEHLGMSGFGVDDASMAAYRGGVAVLVRARPMSHPNAMPPRRASPEELFDWGYEIVRP